MKINVKVGYEEALDFYCFFQLEQLNFFMALLQGVGLYKSMDEKFLMHLVKHPGDPIYLCVINKRFKLIPEPEKFITTDEWKLLKDMGCK